MNNWECDEPVACIWSPGLWGANGETDPLRGSVFLFNKNIKEEKVFGETEYIRMLTIAETANILNVHINTIRRWSNMGILKTYRIGTRGDRRFRHIDIQGMLQQSEVTR